MKLSKELILHEINRILSTGTTDVPTDVRFYNFFVNFGNSLCLEQKAICANELEHEKETKPELKEEIKDIQLIIKGASTPLERIIREN